MVENFKYLWLVFVQGIPAHLVVVADESECEQTRIDPEDEAQIQANAAFEIIAMQLANAQSSVLMQPKIFEISRPWSFLPRDYEMQSGRDISNFWLDKFASQNNSERLSNEIWPRRIYEETRGAIQWAIQTSKTECQNTNASEGKRLVKTADGDYCKGNVSQKVLHAGGVCPGRNDFR